MAATFGKTVGSLVLIFCLGSKVLSEKCENPCCKLTENEKVINIKPIGNMNGSARFTVNGTDNATYSYNPCYEFNQGNETSPCLKVAGCKDNGGVLTSLGLQSSAEWIFKNQQPMITYSWNEKKFSVTLLCNEKLKLENSSFTVNSNNDSEVNATLESKCACPDGCPLQTSPDTPEKKGISTGTLLIILFMVFLIVYLVGGIIYKKVIYGAQGKELIPNVEFWIAFPGLVMDGVAFTCNCCGKRRSRPNYDNV